MAEAKIERKQLKMGVGEAVQRLVQIETNRVHGLASTEELLMERDMILAALNEQVLDFSLFCVTDDVPDGVNVFRHSVQTSCCSLAIEDLQNLTPVTPELPPSPELKVVKGTKRRAVRKKTKAPAKRKPKTKPKTRPKD